MGNIVTFLLDFPESNTEWACLGSEKKKKRIDVCGNSLVFGVSGLMSDLQGDVCVVAKGESWYQCHAIIRMWAPKGHCVCMNPEELQLSGWFS